MTKAFRRWLPWLPMAATLWLGLELHEMERLAQTVGAFVVCVAVVLAYMMGGRATSAHI